MKKRIILIIVLIVIMLLVLLISAMQIANHRRGTAIEAYLADAKIALLDAGVREHEIVYDKGCERGQVVFGQGQKYCWRSLTMQQDAVTLKYARDIARRLEQRIEAQEFAQSIHKSRMNLQLIRENSGGVSGYIASRPYGRTDCSARIRYDGSPNELGIVKITETSLGDMKVHIGCTDTSWWVGSQISF